MKTARRKKSNNTDKRMKDIGQTLKLIRINEGLTQEEVSEKLGVNRSLLSRSEMGENITLKSFLKILYAYNYNFKAFGFLLNDGTIF